jgi:hypothetical protein
MALNSSYGTWTPVATGIANYDGNFVIQYAQFMKVGNVVFCRADVSIGATLGSTTTTVELTLPVATNMTITGHLGGIGSNYNSLVLTATITGNSTSDKAVVSFTSLVTPGFNNFNLIFSYVVL